MSTNNTSTPVEKNIALLIYRCAIIIFNLTITTMEIKFGPSILEHITNIVLYPVYGEVQIKKAVINAGFIVLSLSTGDIVSIDSKTLTIIK